MESKSVIKILKENGFESHEYSDTEYRRENNSGILIQVDVRDVYNTGEFCRVIIKEFQRQGAMIEMYENTHLSIFKYALKTMIEQ